LDFTSDGTFICYSDLHDSSWNYFTYPVWSGNASDTATVSLLYANYEPEGNPDQYAVLDTVPLGRQRMVGGAAGKRHRPKPWHCGGGGQAVLEVVSNTQPVDEHGQPVGTVEVAPDGMFTSQAEQATSAE
jgi:hypothetical protein